MDENQAINENKKRKWPIVLFIIIGVLLLLLLIGVITWNVLLDNMIGRVDESQATLSSDELASMLEETDPVDPSFTGPVLAPEEVTVATEPVETIPSGENTINFLLVGQDRREGQGRQRSDAMILCTLNLEKKTLTMTSFLRDVWVNIPGYYNERLNVPYAIKGFSLLNETLQHNFGVSAEHNIEVDFTGFSNVVDLVGGVDIALTSAEAHHLNRYTGWGLTEGVMHLSGKQALEYSRIRAIDNDFNRTNRQRTVLNALLLKAKSMSLVELTNLAAGVLPMITTDMTNEEITSCITRIVPVLKDLEVISQRIPVDGTYTFASIGGRSVIVLDEEDMQINRKLLADTVGAE